MMGITELHFRWAEGVEVLAGIELELKLKTSKKAIGVTRYVVALYIRQDGSEG